MIAAQAARGRDFAAADEWLRHADALTDRRAPDPDTNAVLANTRASIAAMRGDLDASAAEFRRALRASEDAGNDFAWAMSAINLSMVEMRRGDFAASRELRRQALERRIAISGERAVATSTARVEYAEALEPIDPAGALEQLDAARAVLEHGEANHGGLAKLYFVESKIRARRREYAQAADAAERACAALDRIDSTNVGRRTLFKANLGSARLDNEDFAGARRELDAAIELNDGESTLEGAYAHYTRSTLSWRTGDARGSSVDARRARTLLVASGASDHDLLARTYGAEAAALRELGECGAAVALLEEARATMAALTGGASAVVHGIDGEMAVAMFMCGRADEALARMEKARAGVPEGTAEAAMLAIGHSRILVGPAHAPGRVALLVLAEAIATNLDDDEVRRFVAERWKAEQASPHPASVRPLQPRD